MMDGPWDHTVLHSFCSLPSCADGSQPTGDLILHDGVLYGTTSTGPNSQGGTVFQVNTLMRRNALAAAG
jgi:hypothetical protein